MKRSNQICFAASDEMLRALDVEAFENDQTRAATIREILSDYLRQAGSMAKEAPVTWQLGRIGRFINTRNVR